MQRLAGFIGHLPPEDASRVVVSMAAAMRRDSFPHLAHGSFPEIHTHIAWVSDAPSSLTAAAPGDVRFITAGDVLFPRDVRRSVNGTSRWFHRFETGDAEALASLNGFFAGLAVEGSARRVVLFADRHGIERLYICETPDGLYFASEAKALLAVLAHTRSFDQEGLSQYLAFGCTLPPRTLFRGVHVLPQAACWRWDGHHWDRRRFFDPATLEAQDTLDAAQFEREYADTLLRVLPEYFTDGSRVGLAMTGGLDTRMILAGRPGDWTDPITYTYSAQHDTRDVTLARALAGTCAIPHEVVRVDESFLRDFPSLADRTVLDSDGTHGVTGSHESFLSARVRSLAPVRLTGVFGGEVLRGLSPWRRLDLDTGLLQPELQSLVAEQTVASSSAHPVTAAAYGTTPAAMFGILASCRAWLRLRTPFLDSRLLEIAYRAPRPQTATEQSAVRILRRHLPPLAALPTDRGRQVGGSRLIEPVSRAFEQVSFKADYIANESLTGALTPLDPIIDGFLARGLLGRHKYLRYRRWFRGRLADYLRERTEAARDMDIWQRPAITRLAERHISGHTNATEELNLVLTLEAVERLLLSAPAPSRIESSPSPRSAGGASREDRGRSSR